MQAAESEAPAAGDEEAEERPSDAGPPDTTAHEVPTDQAPAVAEVATKGTQKRRIRMSPMR
jgi:hypothetical protein